MLRAIWNSKLTCTCRTCRKKTNIITMNYHKEYQYHTSLKHFKASFKQLFFSQQHILEEQLPSLSFQSRSASDFLWIFALPGGLFLAKRNTKGSKNIQLVADMKTLKLSTSWFVKDPRELFDRCWQPPTATLDSQRHSLFRPCGPGAQNLQCFLEAVQPIPQHERGWIQSGHQCTCW